MTDIKSPDDIQHDPLFAKTWGEEYRTDSRFIKWADDLIRTKRPLWLAKADLEGPWVDTGSSDVRRGW